MKLHPLAEKLNTTLDAHKSSLLGFLSQRGKSIYFPWGGTVGQASEAKGKEIDATLGIALDDSGMPLVLPSMASKISLDPKRVFPYAPSHGIPELRTEWKERMLRKNPTLQSLCSTPIATAGLTNSISTAISLVLDPSEEVHLPIPSWDNYALIIQEGHGGSIRPFPLFEGSSFNISGLKAGLKSRKGKHIILLNFPNNPTGFSIRSTEVHKLLEALRECADEGRDIVVIIDDAYTGFFYEDDVYKESLFGRIAGLHERVLAIKVDGASKEQYAWGLRVGFLTFARKGITEDECKALEDKIAGLVRWNLSNASRLSQELLLTALRSPSYEEECARNFEVLRERFQSCKEVLSRTEFKGVLTPLPSNSGYFICLDFPSAEIGEKIRKLLLSEYEIGVIAYGKLLRIAFSTVPQAKLPRLFESILKASERVMKTD